MAARDRTSGVVVESMESRLLYAATYLGADYFPVVAGQSGTFDIATTFGQSTVSRTVAAASGGQVRFRDSGTVNSESLVVDRYYSQGGTGTFSHRTDLVSASSIVNGTIIATTPIIPASFGLGAQISSWSGVAFYATLTIPSLGISGQSVSGTTSGRSYTGASLSRVDEGGYSFLNTINLTVEHRQVFNVTVGGNPLAVTLYQIEDNKLAKGIGVVTGTTRYILSAVGLPNTAETDLTYIIKTSSQVPSFTRLTGSTLRVGGSTGDDVIGAGFEGSNILVVRNNVGKAHASSGITRIVIDASSGNDVVGPLKLARMKSNLIGGDGNDYLTGGSGRDLIYGGNGNDTVVGGPGIDTLFGDAGNDILNGLSGADLIDGGPGTDTTKTDAADTRVAIEVLI